MNNQNRPLKTIYGLGYSLTPGIFNWNFGSVSSENILRGKVVDFTTNKPLSGAHVYYIKNGLPEGVITNQFGEYALPVPANETIYITFLGYDGVIDLANNIDKVEYLSPKTIALDEVEIIHKKEQPKKNNTLAIGLSAIGAIILGVTLANSEK